MDQLSLFDLRSGLPEGLKYRPELFEPATEHALVQRIQELPFAPFEFHGFLGKRRIVSFGWRYGFDGSGLARVEPIPDFLLPLRDWAADFAGFEAEEIEHALVTEYQPGAGIGWHKDRSVFGKTIGISLVSACRLRFRRKAADKWQRSTLLAEPRSAYLLDGPSRSEWEHGIAAVDQLRYSVTFRTLVGGELTR
jgi:alkylated DNA repair dioxygenase AlkB